MGYYMVGRLPKKVKELLEKAKESCILAVDIYNKPKTSFRSGAFIILMNIAWTSLFHAIFERNKVKYYYREKNSIRYKRKDGDKLAWELHECVKYYFKNNLPNEIPIKENIRFFIPLRNKIEHRFMPDLDSKIFGECQALLHNFEYILNKEFGEKHVINESLVFSLQFAKWHPKSDGTVKKSPSDLVNIEQYIDKFRKDLPAEVSSDQRYRFNVFLIPNITNNKNEADYAIRWINYDKDNPEEMEGYTQLMGILKEKEASVANKGRLRPGEVDKRVRDKLADKYGFQVPFNHIRCCLFYEIRPPSNATNKEETKTNFCTYDTLHDDYSYTEQWVNFLVNKLSVKEEYLRVFPNQKKLMLNILTTTEVSRKVKIELRRIYGPNIKFGTDKNLDCAVHYGIRPPMGTEPINVTNETYCFYNGNNSYLYTQQWFDFLIEELSDETKFLSLFPDQAQFITGVTQ